MMCLGEMCTYLKQILQLSIKKHPLDNRKLSLKEIQDL